MRRVPRRGGDDLGVWDQKRPMNVYEGIEPNISAGQMPQSRRWMFAAMNGIAHVSRASREVSMCRMVNPRLDRDRPWSWDGMTR